MLHKHPVLTTQRLTLRQPGMHDEQEIFALRTDPDIHQYLDRPIADSIDDARTFIKRINEHTDKNNSLYWAITFSDHNRLVGTVCLFNFSADDEKCEIGYELLPNFQGKGVMTEALEKVIDYAFNTIGVRKIEAFVHKDNVRSIVLLKKLLFSEGEGTDLICYHLGHL
jgi:[ribosomal protein S5]-alanine N-acetyltransferase